MCKNNYDVDNLSHNTRKGDVIIETIIHPISGEKGFFCTNEEKILIDAIINDYSNQFVLNASPCERCVNE